MLVTTAELLVMPIPVVCKFSIAGLAAVALPLGDCELPGALAHETAESTTSGILLTGTAGTGYRPASDDDGGYQGVRG